MCSSCRMSCNIRERGPRIVWYDPRTDHRTSLETISNVLNQFSKCNNIYDSLKNVYDVSRY